MPKIKSGDASDVSRFLHSVGFRTFGHENYCDCARRATTHFRMKVATFDLSVALDRPSAKNLTARIGLVLFQTPKQGGSVVYKYKRKQWSFHRIRQRQNHLFDRDLGYTSLYLSSNWKTRFLDSLLKAFRFIQAKSNVPEIQEIIAKLSFARQIA